MVCDKPVWRNLLEGIEDFDDLGEETGRGEDVNEDEDEDEVEDIYEDEDKRNKERMDKLVKFLEERGSLEMKTEVLREVAKRFEFHDGGDFYSSSTKGWRCGFRGRFKVTVSIEGWGEGEAPSTFEIRSGHLSSLHDVAQAVGAQFTIKEVKTFAHLISIESSIETFKLIDKLVNQQNEGLDRLEVKRVTMYSNCQDIFFSLVRASKEWVVEKMHIDPFVDCNWTELARSAAAGHIGTLEVFRGRMQEARKEDIKAVWEISEKLKNISNPFVLVGGVSEIGGGRGEDPKITWEEAYQALFA